MQLTEVQLAQPTKKDMRFEIYREIKPPSDPVSALYFEVSDMGTDIDTDTDTDTDIA